MSTPPPITGALGAVAAFLTAMTSGGLSVWTAGALTTGGLLLVAAVLFLPSETPARRLAQLIRAWQSPSPPATGRNEAAPLPLTQNGP